MKNPLVSIILPVYNAQKTIKEALLSIVNQTYRNIEIIIINDGSYDNSKSIIKSINDERICYYDNDGNKGIIYSLNRAINIAKGEYIARMDADDISLPLRVERQVSIMENNPQIAVCGCNIELFGVTDNKKKSTLQMLNSNGLKSLLVKVPCFAHPTVMIRKSVLDENNLCYDQEYLHAEDYKLWIDMAKAGDFYMIKEKLFKYRISNTQITQPSNIKQIETAKRCRLLYIDRFIGKHYADSIAEEGVSLSLIKSIKKVSSNKFLLDVLYLSFSRYSLEIVLYYLFSLDCFRLGRRTFLQFFKRVFLSPNPYL